MYNIIPFLIIGFVVWVIRRAGRAPLWAEAYRRLAKNRAAMAALVVICLYALVAVFDSVSWQSSRGAEPKTVIDRIFAMPPERTYSAPLASHTTGEPHPHKLERKHLLGTDGLGNDVVWDVMKGCRTALIIGLLTQVFVTPIALFFGLMAGYFGKRVDDAIQYVYTVLDSIPSILLLIVLLMVMGRGLWQICVALGVTSWVSLCRLVRGETLKHRDRDYVRAARALGVGHTQILVKHITPNLLPIIIITATLGVSANLLSETILAYLQIGVPPGIGSWGNMIDAARMELARQPVIWWNLTAASVAVFILVLAFNIFGDALRDAVDPRLRS
jgi:peptide/nickel transport system permease protein